MRHRFEDAHFVRTCRLPVAWEHLPRGLGQRYVGSRAVFETAERVESVASSTSNEQRHQNIIEMGAVEVTKRAQSHVLRPAHFIDF